MTKIVRPKISIFIAMSIDGYIAQTDGGLDWLKYGHTGDEDYGFQNFITKIDAIILGRRTYEAVSKFKDWPYHGKRVIVLSHTLKQVRDEAELFCGKLSDLTSTLYLGGIKHIWVDGGVCISKFLEENLVDEITISIISLILGAGIPLFSSIQNRLDCQVVTCQTYPSGLVQIKYAIL